MILEDENNDGFISPGEGLNCKIIIVNIGTDTAENILVCDPLNLALPYIEAPEASPLVVKRNGKVDQSLSYTVANLMNGFYIDLAEHETTTISYHLRARADPDMSSTSVMICTVSIGDTDQNDLIKAEMEMLSVAIEADKSQFVGNDDELIYAISFRMPEDVSSFQSAKIVSLFGDVLKYEKGSASLFVDGACIDNIDEYLSVYYVPEEPVPEGTGSGSEGENLLCCELNDSLLNAASGKRVELKLTFTVQGWVKGSIRTAAELFLRYIGGDYLPEPNTVGSLTITKKPLGNIVSSMRVTNENRDNYASPGELLTYRIAIANMGQSTAEDILIYDSLSSLLPHIETPNYNTVIIRRDGDIDNSLYYVAADLMSGFYVNLSRDETLTVDFSVKIKEDFDAAESTVLINSAVVGDTDLLLAEIETLGVAISAHKRQFDGNNDELSYTISFRMPADISCYQSIKVALKLPDTLKYIEGSGLLSIDNCVDEIGEPIRKYIVMSSDHEGNLYYELWVEDDFSALAGKQVRLDASFLIKKWTKGSIVNEAQLYFRPLSGDYPLEPNVKDCALVTKKPTGEIVAYVSVDNENQDDYASPGEILTYNITIVNLGQTSAEDIFVRDSLSSLLPHIETPTANPIIIRRNNDLDLTESYTVANLMSGFYVSLAEDEILSISYDVVVSLELDAIETTFLRTRTKVGDIYPPSATEIETLDVSLNMSKVNRAPSAERNDELTCSIYFRMPEDLINYESVKIFSVMQNEHSLNCSFHSGTLLIGKESAGSIAMDADDIGNLFYELSGSSFIDATGKLVRLNIVYDIYDIDYRKNESININNDINKSVIYMAELYFKPAEGEYGEKPNVRKSVNYSA